MRGGEEDADGLRLQRLRLGEELRARHARHHVVGGEDLEWFLPQSLQRLGRIRAGDHLVTRSLEGALQSMQDGRLVVDDEETFDLWHLAPALSRAAAYQYPAESRSYRSRTLGG